jgi:hypothetical protein
MERRRLTDYLCSLPERVVRSASAILGGAAYQMGEIVLPARLRRSRLYGSLVESTVRFLVETVGQVEMPSGESLPPDFLARRAAGNVVEIAGLAAFRASPVWVLAALADLAGAGRDLLGEIAATLQKEGLLAQGEKFETTGQLLDGLERTSGRLAETVNTPPLNVAALREELRLLRQEAASIPKTVLASAERLWTDLKEEARAQNKSVVELSSLMALVAVRELPARALWLSNAVRAGGWRAGEVVARGLLDHYRTTLAGIHAAGYWSYFRREFQPYLAGAAAQFSMQRTSATERLLARTRRPASTGLTGAAPRSRAAGPPDRTGR